MNKMKLLLTLAIPVLLSQDTQAQSSRLTAQAHWTHNGAEFLRGDSTAYNYLSTVRGGDLNSLLKFDDGTNWTYAMGDTQNNNMRWVQEFDANNNLSTRVDQQWDMMLMSWANTWKYTYTYNSANKKTSMVQQHWDGTSAWITDSKNTYTYNAAGVLESDAFSVWDGVGSYILTSQKTYYYDASGNMINETWNDWVSSAPVYTARVNYTFNSSNKELTATHSMWNGAAWDDVEMYENTYDTASGNRTSRMHKNFTGMVFVPDMLMLYSNFTSGHPMTEIDQTYDTAGAGSWADMYKFTNTYNSNGQLTSSTRQSYDISLPGWTNAFGDTKANYYYGAFVSVKNVSNTAGNAILFPVPAQNTLNVTFNWNHAQAATVTVVDVQGKVVMTVNATAAQANVSLPVANLADGIYVVKIVGAVEGQVVKQISVAH
jgi:hypothetical protein